MSQKQLSRMAGVPRMPLKAWKRAAEALLTGEDITRAEQQNGKKTKVQVLKMLAASDKEWRSKIITFFANEQAAEAKNIIAKQGWAPTPTETDPQPTSTTDRIVRAVEAAERDGTIPGAPMPPLKNGRHDWHDGDYRAARADWWNTHVEPFLAESTAEELSAPEDPEKVGVLAELLKLDQRPAPIHGCNQCGRPATRVLDNKTAGRAEHYCDSCPRQLPPTPSPTGAEYHLHGWQAPTPTPTAPTPNTALVSPAFAAEQAAIRDAVEAIQKAPGGPDYGPQQPAKPHPYSPYRY